MGAGTGTGGEESESFPARSLGQKVGALVHKLTVGQLASHSHGGKTGTSTTGAGGFHSHLILASTTNNPASGGAWEGGGGEWTFGGVSFQSPTYVGVDTGITNGSGEHTHTVPALAISAEGGGEAHNIVQPSTTCNVWIKF
jgi:microcystin-dependent protein